MYAARTHTHTHTHIHGLWGNRGAGWEGNIVTFLPLLMTVSLPLFPPILHFLSPFSLSLSFTYALSPFTSYSFVLIAKGEGRGADGGSKALPTNITTLALANHTLTSLTLISNRSNFSKKLKKKKQNYASIQKGAGTSGIGEWGRNVYNKKK